MSYSPEYNKYFCTQDWFYKELLYWEEEMRINDAFILRNIYGKYILMPIQSNETSNDPILLNEVAATIWNVATVYNERENIIENIMQIYNLKENSTEMLAVEQFVEQMIKMELLIDV